MSSARSYNFSAAGNCRRYVEVYAAASETVTTEQIAHCLARGGTQLAEDGAGFYRYEGQECVRHLFQVVCGLNSMVIGETEILGQVKKAYAFARESGSAGPLHEMSSTWTSCMMGSTGPKPR